MWYLHPSQRPHRRYLFSTKQLQDQHVIPKKKPIKGEKSVWFSPKINAMATKTPAGEDPKKLERTGRVREIGSQAIWSLSSCKPGFGVDQLRDDNLETYWQSDGSQPHLVNIQFRRKTAVKTVCIYADYKADESYTPSRVSLRVGNNFHDLQEIRLCNGCTLTTLPGISAKLLGCERGKCVTHYQLVLSTHSRSGQKVVIPSGASLGQIAAEAFHHACPKKVCNATLADFF
uniref:uncharacterized protein isoform X2 n=1 Tax=Myxine glutinosa TaxID=7769 RepID=UPI00359021C8